MMPTLEFIVRAISAVVLICAGAGLAHRTTMLLMGSQVRLHLPLRWALLSACGMWLASVAFQFLYAVGGFKLVWALPAVCAADALLRFWEKRQVQRGKIKVSPTWLDEFRIARRLWRRLRQAKHYPLVSIFLPPSLFIALRTMIVLPAGWDSFTYHSVRPARWVQNAGFGYEDAPGVWNLFRHYFGGAEVLYGWAALPMHSDLLVACSTFVQWLCIGLALWACSRALGVREPFAGLLALSWLFVPTIFQEIGSGYVELAMTASAMAGVAACLYFIRRPHKGVAVLGAMALGVSGGTKLPGLLPAAVGGLALAFVALWPTWPLELQIRKRRDQRLPRRWKHVLLWVTVCLAPIAPWLIFNVIETGYPLSPAPLRIAGITLGVNNPAMEFFQDRGLQIDNITWRQEWDAVCATIGDLRIHALCFGPLVVMWLLPMPICLLMLARHRFGQAALLLCLFSVTVAYYFLPGMVVARILWPLEGGRYLLIGLICPTLINMAALSRWTSLARIYLFFVVSTGLFYAFRQFGFGVWDGEYSLIGYCFLGLSVSVAGFAWLAKRIAPKPLAVGVALVAVGQLYALDYIRVHYRRDFMQWSFQMVPSPRYYVPSLKHIDDGNRHVIAATSGVLDNVPDWPAYIFYGAYLQNTIIHIPISTSGEIVHFDRKHRQVDFGDYKAWYQRILERGVTEIISFHPHSLEYDWMVKHPEIFTKLEGDLNWGLFRVKRTTLDHRIK